MNKNGTDIESDAGATEWTLEDRAEDEIMARTIASATHLRAEDNDGSGSRPSLSMEEAGRTIEELRAEDAVHNDVQRALA